MLYFSWLLVKNVGPQIAQLLSCRDLCDLFARIINLLCRSWMSFNGFLANYLHLFPVFFIVCFFK